MLRPRRAETFTLAVAAAALWAALLGCTPQWDTPLTVPPTHLSADGSVVIMDTKAQARMGRHFMAVGGDMRWREACQEAILPSAIDACVWQHYVEHVRPLIASGAVLVRR